MSGSAVTRNRASGRALYGVGRTVNSAVRRLWCGVLLAACGDPAFVSLGRNIQSVAAEVDAGSTGSPVRQPSSTCEASATSSGPAANEITFGCASEPAPVPEPDCQLLGEPVPVDTACEQRQTLSCPDAYAPERLRAQLFDIVARCTDLAYELTATFEAGCATAFSLDALELPISASVRDCVAARLSSERYDCAQTVTCAVGSTYPIPTR